MHVLAVLSCPCFLNEGWLRVPVGGGLITPGGLDGRQLQFLEVEADSELPRHLRLRSRCISEQCEESIIQICTRKVGQQFGE